MKWVFVILMTIATQVLCAQTWEEWMEQKKTSLKYLTEHIVALKAYGGSLEKGYKIVQAGLLSIDVIKQGDFFQHAQQIDALFKANPQLKSSDKLKASKALLSKILHETRNIESFISSNDQLQTKEKKYLSSVLSHLFGRCNAILQEIELITEDDLVQMADDERLIRLNAVYNKMQGELQFVTSFKKEVELFTVNRWQERLQIRMSERLYDLKK